MSLDERQRIRPCGKQYASEAEALASKRGRSGNYVAARCEPGCQAWHLRRRPVGAVTRKPAPKDTGAEGFPEAIRKAAIERDHGHCIACGDDRALHVHHRRIKGMGGDSRAHTDCLCNAAVLCRLCHLWAHAQRRESEAQGFVVSRETELPGSISVMVFGPGGGGATLFATCDGQWSSSQVSA